MIEIIPAILEKDFYSVQKRISQAEKYFKIAQVDITDGKFVYNQTFNDSVKFLKLVSNIDLEMHLMIDKPEKNWEKWAKHKRVKRIVFHAEVASNPEKLIAEIKKKGKQVGIALNPPTDEKFLIQLVDQLDLVLILGVNPGFAGQEFISTVLDKIKNIRSYSHKVNIACDGGVKLDNVIAMVNAGANIIVTNTLIFKDDNIEENLSQIRKLVG